MTEKMSQPQIVETLIKQGPRILRFTVVGDIVSLTRHCNQIGPGYLVTGQLQTIINNKLLHFIVMSGLAKKREDVLVEGCIVRMTLNLDAGFIEGRDHLTFVALDIEPV